MSIDRIDDTSGQCIKISVFLCIKCEFLSFLVRYGPSVIRNIVDRTRHIVDGQIDPAHWKWTFVSVAGLVENCCRSHHSDLGTREGNLGKTESLTL